MSSVSDCSSCAPVEIAATLQKKQIDAQGEVAKGLIESAASSAPKGDAPGKTYIASA